MCLLILPIWSSIPAAATHCPADGPVLGRMPETFELLLAHSDDPGVDGVHVMDFVSVDGCGANRWIISDGHVVVERTDEVAVLAWGAAPVVLASSPEPESWVGWLDEALWWVDAAGDLRSTSGDAPPRLPEDLDAHVVALPPRSERPQAAPGWTIADGGFVALVHDGAADGVGSREQILVSLAADGEERWRLTYDGSLQSDAGQRVEFDRLRLRGASGDVALLETITDGIGRRHWQVRPGTAATEVPVDLHRVRTDEPLVRQITGGGAVDPAVAATRLPLEPAALTWLNGTVAILGVSPDAWVATSDGLTATWWDRIDRGTVTQLIVTGLVVGGGVVAAVGFVVIRWLVKRVADGSPDQRAGPPTNERGGTG